MEYEKVGFSNPSNVVKIRNVEKSIRISENWMEYFGVMIVHHKVVVLLLRGCSHWQTLRFLVIIL